MEACGINPKLPENIFNTETWWDKFGGYVIAGIIALVFILICVLTWGGGLATAPAWMQAITLCVWKVKRIFDKMLSL